MAENIAELKHMIMSFRVSELQVLLGFAGRNKSGRKQELLQRALSLIQKNPSIPVQIKIRELYRQNFEYTRELSPENWKHIHRHSTKQIFSSSANRRRFASPTSSPSGHGSEAHHVTPAPTQGISSHYASYSSDPSGPIDFSSKHIAPAPAPSAIPVHPDVRFRRLPFYDVLGDLMKPTSLVPSSTNRFQESYFVFHLTPQQAQDIAMSRDYRAGAKHEFTVQVQLRFCLLETSCEQNDNFPPSICVRVNGKLAPLPNPTPTTKPGVEPKRPGRPVDITSLCRLSPTISNHLDISWASEFGRGYCLTVYLVRRLSSDILLQRLKQFGQRHPDHTRALIKEKLACDPDSEIATTSLRVSLMCPLGKMRIQLPSRASTCNHLQTFDASTFLMMNEKKPTWICPVCDKPAPFDKLIIDGYFVEICRSAGEYSDIMFHQDGSWRPLKTNKETHLVASPMQSKSPLPSTSTSSAGLPSSPKKQKVTVIDLTLSSDEEDTVDSGPSKMSGPSSCSSRQSSEAGCVSPPIINLDTPTPPHSSTRSLSSSPSTVVLSHCQSNSQSPIHSPQASPSSMTSVSSSSMAGATSVPSLHSTSLADRLQHSVAPSPSSSSFTVPPSPSFIPTSPTYSPTSPAYIPSPSSTYNPLPAPSAPLLQPLPGSSSVPPIPNSSGLSMPGINIENLSDTDFDEFLQNLAWGV